MAITIIDGKGTGNQAQVTASNALAISGTVNVGGITLSGTFTLDNSAMTKHTVNPSGLAIKFNQDTEAHLFQNADNNNSFFIYTAGSVHSGTTWTNGMRIDPSDSLSLRLNISSGASISLASSGGSVEVRRTALW